VILLVFLSIFHNLLTFSNADFNRLTLPFQIFTLKTVNFGPQNTFFHIKMIFQQIYLLDQVFLNLIHRLTIFILT